DGAARPSVWHPPWSTAGRSTPDRTGGLAARVRRAMQKLTVRAFDVRGERVLLRTDYNVDVVNGQVLDDLRIQASLTTIHELRALSSARTAGARRVDRIQGAPARFCS
ncbi:MAG TPA: phosphoglycerate kinase, partial [Rhodothermia bacterium]